MEVWRFTIEKWENKKTHTQRLSYLDFNVSILLRCLSRHLERSSWFWPSQSSLPLWKSKSDHFLRSCTFQECVFNLFCDYLEVSLPQKKHRWIEIHHSDHNHVGSSFETHRWHLSPHRSTWTHHHHQAHLPCTEEAQSLGVAIVNELKLCSRRCKD